MTERQTYNHVFSVCFIVPNSLHADGDDCLKEEAWKCRNQFLAKTTEMFSEKNRGELTEWADWQPEWTETEKGECLNEEDE